MTQSSYGTITMDPPWPERGGGRVKRGADRHYPLMSAKDTLCTVLTSGVWRPADTCHLYVWATNNYMPDAFWLMDALGFNYKHLITWAKDRTGLGQYRRGQTEHCLFGVRGKAVLPETKDRTSTLLGGGLIQRGRHSQKPEEFFKDVERVSPGPYLEMFARQQRQGWDVWGNEV